MSTKKKMIISAISMCLVMLVAVVSVVVVWAASTASVQNNINITYQIEKNLSGSMKVRYLFRENVEDNLQPWTNFLTTLDEESVVFNKNNTPSSSFTGNATFDSYKGIEPMLIVEIQLTNDLVVPYQAELDLWALDTSYANFDWVENAYCCRDMFNNNQEMIPKTSMYYSNPEDFDKETISMEKTALSGEPIFQSSPYQINQGGVSCFYVCFVPNEYITSDSFVLDFTLTLYNAYDAEV